MFPGCLSVPTRVSCLSLCEPSPHQALLAYREALFLPVPASLTVYRLRPSTLNVLFLTLHNACLIISHGSLSGVRKGSELPGFLKRMCYHFSKKGSNPTPPPLTKVVIESRPGIFQVRKKLSVRLTIRTFEDCGIRHHMNLEGE